jgi:hypothetical protein
MRRLCLALVHHPVLDRQGAVITTAITNLDLHDMARSARTYGLSDMFVVHPVEAQRQLAERVRDHWLHGSGQRRIPDRAPPMRLLRVVSGLRAAYDELGGRDAIEVWTTSARRGPGMSCTYEQARERIWGEGPPVMLLFGTGWGLAAGLVDESDVRIEPIRSATETGFNHLSVRAACAITLDRLVGERPASAEHP